MRYLSHRRDKYIPCCTHRKLTRGDENEFSIQWLLQYNILQFTERSEATIEIITFGF